MWKNPSELRIAKWRDRFFAWLIDVLIIWTCIAIIHSAITLALWHGEFGLWTMTTGMEQYPRAWTAHGFLFGSGTSLVFFVYWSILEYRSGQSLGKRILHIKTVNLDGDGISIKQSVLNSFGKSFLFGIDVILGLIFTRKKRQRIFNRISNSIVVKIQDDNEPSISYKMD